jgi:hypothetical protein
MINKLDLIKEYREMFSVDNKELANKAEYYILNDLRRRSTFDKVAEIDYSIISNFLEFEIKNFLNVSDKNVLLMFLEQRYFNEEEVKTLNSYLYENHFFKNYDLVSKKDVINDIRMHIINESERLYNKIKDEIEYYKHNKKNILN